MRSFRTMVGPLCVALMLAVALPAAAKGSVVGRLGLGDSAFWNGTRVERSSGNNCAGEMKCFDYFLEIVDRGQLRLAIDSIDGDDYYVMRLFHPSDNQVASDSPIYSAELYAYVSPGTWRVRVEARNVTDGLFRMRAKLGRPEFIGPDRGPRRALLPNLRLLPPFKFTFESPGWTAAGNASGCTEDEIVEHRPARCLRFSLGPANFGDGPLELRYEELEGVVTAGKIYQRIRYSDGSSKEREAGEFQYHAAHGHFHHAGFGSLELLRVTDPKTGAMKPAGEGPKQGFCMAPYVIVDWRSFNNDRAGTANANCFEFTPATGSHMGLDRGWADIYDWYLSGNYVEFGNNTDGLYVVRSMTDANRDILETDESDNWGYAYIRVSGDDIRVLERGYGKSPWDPDKIVEPVWLLLTV